MVNRKRIKYIKHIKVIFEKIRCLSLCDLLSTFASCESRVHQLYLSIYLLYCIYQGLSFRLYHKVTIYIYKWVIYFDYLLEQKWCLLEWYKFTISVLYNVMFGHCLLIIDKNCPSLKGLCAGFFSLNESFTKRTRK